MLVPPLPWSRTSRGGYVGLLRGRLPLIKQKPDACIASVEQVLFDSLNRVQATPWRINRAVLRLAERIEQSGTNPLARKPLPLTPERKARTREEGSRLAKVRRFHTTLDVAREMAGAERIYFPHHLDFRGRFFAIPQPLNLQGDDLARALLCFADGKPVGDKGGFWLALHGANCLGETPDGVNLAQETLEKRVIHIERLTEAIETAATNPLTSDLMTAAIQHGEPWQLYAFAIEWTEYMKEVAAGRGALFVSHLPCGQDGSCNGLQHVAALWHDKELAARVNLLRSERPNDFYTDMLETVQERLHAEAQGSVQLPESWTRHTNSGKKRIQREKASAAEREVEGQRRRELASAWLDSNFLARRLMKTPAMTYGYGASRRGVMENTADHIRDEVPEPFDRPFSVHQREDPNDVFEPVLSRPPSPLPAENESELMFRQTEPAEDAWEHLSARDLEEWRILDMACDQFTEESLRELWSEEGRAFNYLAGIMYDVMQAEAGDYREWFRTVARRVVGRKQATSEEIKQWTPSTEPENPGRPVAWTAPVTGLTVVQDVPKYWEWQDKRVKPVKIQGAVGGISYQERRPTTIVRVRKQVNSLAPNVVHSLDAAHLALTVALAPPEVRSWGVIHDSYHVFAADALALAQTLLEAFRKLHEQDILGDLHRQFSEQASADVPTPPRSGDLAIADIQGRYAFA
jgi:DNA-directed RNA polymerase